MRTGSFLPLLAPALLAQAPAAAPAAAPQSDPFAPLRFLVGEWQSAESSGSPGQAARGGFSLLPDLDGRALVRRSFAEYPAQGGRPAFRHQDLMAIYAEGGQLRALYLDNEGHAIHYEVSALVGGGAIFQSGGEGPRFRMTYRPAGPDLVTPDRVDLAFDIAPPGKAFANYLKAQVRRKM